MVGRGLEWSHCLEGGPCSWSSINSEDEDFPIEAAPELHLILFSADFMARLLCRFVHWHPEDAQVAVFEAEELDDDGWISYPAETLYVREVPSPFVVTCSLTPVACNKIDVVFRHEASGLSTKLKVHALLMLKPSYAIGEKKEHGDAAYDLGFVEHAKQQECASESVS